VSGDFSFVDNGSGWAPSCDCAQQQKEANNSEVTALDARLNMTLHASLGGRQDVPFEECLVHVGARVRDKKDALRAICEQSNVWIMFPMANVLDFTGPPGVAPSKMDTD